MRARLKILLTLCRPAAHAQFENFFLPDAVSKSTRFAGAANVTQWQDDRAVTTKSLFGSALDAAAFSRSSIETVEREPAPSAGAAHLTCVSAASFPS
jgi:hypothetical protein